ncbi:MAG: nucleotidyltransferase family protein [Anaerohalosphaeraceae bacterium]|nr:nucleotidyltransferase family protein [Anaerohalosphaeraceae bacterium]
MKLLEAGNIDVLILCGGKGTRLQSVVSDRPKPMAVIGEKPFLDIVIGQVAKFGFKRIILCAGYKAESIQEYYSSQNSLDLEIVVSKESTSLGTGGAVKNAEEFIQSDPVLILNGDSFFDMDFNRFVEFYQNKKALLAVSILDAENTESYGSIKIDESDMVVGFCEKISDSNKGMINAGVYLFSRKVIETMPNKKKFSLEYDFFSTYVNRQFYGYLAEGSFIDIGTPQRYLQAKKNLNIF